MGLGSVPAMNHWCPPALAFQRAGPIAPQAGPVSDEAVLVLGATLS